MKTILVLLFILSLLFISGCETFHGLGRDIEHAGEWIQGKSN